MEAAKVGQAAFCRRPYETRLFTPETLRETASASIQQLSTFLDEAPAPPPDLDLSTEDVGFREGFHRWCRQVREKTGPDLADAFKPKQRHRKERVLKEPLVTLDVVTSRAAAASSTGTFGVDAVVEEAGNVLRSRLTSRRTTPKEDEEREELEPEEETVEEVRMCIEKLTGELNTPMEMITQKNTNLKGAPFRRNLFKMYRRIAKYLEECEGRVFLEPAQSRKKRVRRLSPEEAVLVQSRIAELTEKLEGLQDAALQNENISQGEVEIEERHPSDAECCAGRPAAAQFLGDVVVEIEMVHPSFLKSRGTCVTALGRHRLREVIDLCTCTSDDTMTAMEETANPRYVFIEGIFYVEDGDEAVLKDIEAIKSFCQVHGCGWPLDVTHPPNWDFQVASLSTSLSEIPLRASNKPLYLYSHHGGCEHLLHVLNVRMPHTGDNPALQYGPVRTHTARITVRKCSICEKTFACHVVYASQMNITDPCFYCETCYYVSHYDYSGVETERAKGHIAYPYRGG